MNDSNYQDMYSSQILRYLHDAVIVTDLQFRITRWNLSAEKIYGYSEEEALGQSTDLLRTLMSPESKEESILMLHEKGIWQGHVRQQNKNGDHLQIDSSVSLLKDSEGNTVGVIAVNKDVTEAIRIKNALLDSEELFRLGFENARMGICLLSLNGNFLKVNQMLCDILGYSSEELLGKSLDEFVYDTSEIESDDFIELALKGQKNSTQYETRFLTKSHKFVWAEVTCTLIHNYESKPIYFIKHINDISKRKEAEILLVESKEIAEKANRAKSEFIANISHEIRTPLNGVVGFNELISTTELDDIQKEYINKAISSAHGLLGIINDVLDISKIEAGKLELNEVFVSLNQIIDETIGVLKWKATEKGINLRVNVHAGLPRYIFIDPTRLRQILINLLGNAVKFTQEGFVELDVSSTSSILTPNLIQLQFKVSDTGIGIPPEYKEHLFEPFWQGDMSTTRLFGGTGLGLRITKSLLDLMKATISIHSEVGVGSTFTCIFECRFENKDLEDYRLKDLSDFQLRSSEPQLESLTPKILIVEDYELNRFLLHKIIQKTIPSAVLIDAVDGEEALEKYKIQKPDIVFMDIQMPKMDGLQAAIEIRKMEKNNQVPIIALTAGALFGERQKCFEVGMNHFLTKPIDVIALNQVLSQFLGSEKS